MEFAGLLINSNQVVRTLILVTAFCFPLSSHSNTLTNEHFRKLDQQLINVSSAFYSFNKKHNQHKYFDIKSLQNKVNQLLSNGQGIKAVSLITYNLKALNTNIDDPAVLDILSLLLNYNELTIANQLYKRIQSEADRGTISGASYLFAKYFYQRKQYTKTLQLLSGVAEDLPGDDSNHAILLSGICLQKLKKHRQSIKVYSNINSQSKYYPAAILNTSIANIRQGWWTDGHVLLHKVLDDPKYINSESVINRLYLVLGYSLLHKEFYRDAREAFRNVGLDSQHTNRALMGISLTAISQEDYVGALNALTILKSKNTIELTIDEAYLLLPFVYEKLGQGLTASNSYSEAMNYYKNRIDELNEVKNSINNKTIFPMNAYKNNSIIINNIQLDYSAQFPAYFVDNYKIVTLLRNETDNNKNPKLKKRIDKLFSVYQSSFNKIVISLIDHYISQINSYMNQTRYGLARLYDKNESEQ